VNSKFLAIQLPNQTKKNRIMKKRNITLLTAFAAAVAFASTAQADVITAPTDGYTGPYRLMFVTTATTLSTSTDIGTYNTFADTRGDLVLSGDWKVLGGTATISARDNTGALATGDAGYSAAIDVPIYTLDGDRVFANNTELWTGINLNKLTLNTGADPAFNQFAFTGFLPGGDIIALGGSNYSGPLGETIGKISGALTTRVGGTGIWVAAHEDYHPDANPIIALSGVIGSTTPAADPEITSITSLGSGDFELTLKGEPSTSYEFRSSPTLDFTSGTSGTLVTGLTATVGTIPAGGLDVTTDGSGDATVQMPLAGPANFVRAVKGS